MTLYDDRYQTPGIFGDVSGIPAQVQERKMLAQRLLNNFGEMPKGEMISGHYVAPSWTQQLASALKGPLAMREIAAANKQMGDYNNKKRQDIAAILSGQTPQTVVTGEQKTMPAYTPEQMDRFGSPVPGVERQPVTTQTTQTETPEQVQARLRPLIYAAASQYGNDPALQLMLSDMNYGRQRSDARADKLDDRNFNIQNEDRLYNRNRQDKLSDIDAQRKYEDIVRKEQMGQQINMQDRQFAQQFEMQKSNQNFQAGMQANQQKFTSTENAKNRQGQIDLATGKLNSKNLQTPQQLEQSTITAQQALDQASKLFNHEGKGWGTGGTSWTSSIPGTPAKGFQANLDTFKAQTFIPMVSALKGMGALSDAEGKKLADSVGALDPSMPEKEFNDNLKEVARTLYSKAKASGLNVTLPAFATDTGASGGWSITPVGK
jgi:hypothetical protein